MKAGTAALKVEMASIDLGEIEDNLDDMAELLEESNEIQEVAAPGRCCALRLGCSVPPARLRN